jgi:hypothetical protein
MDNKEEIWKDIPNYEGYYQVSNLGKVRTLTRTIKCGTMSYEKKGKLLTLCKNSRGYIIIGLNKSAIRKSFTAHRLVISTFIGDSNLHIDHINGDKTDNRLDNLRYVTNRQNKIYGSISKRGGVGYSYHKGMKKYASTIRHNGEKIKLGYFYTKEEASKAYFDYLNKNIL